jgi:BMFP domain-containing protein YqiC
MAARGSACVLCGDEGATQRLCARSPCAQRYCMACVYGCVRMTAENTGLRADTACTTLAHEWQRMGMTGCQVCKQPVNASALLADAYAAGYAALEVAEGALRAARSMCRAAPHAAADDARATREAATAVRDSVVAAARGALEASDVATAAAETIAALAADDAVYAGEARRAGDVASIAHTIGASMRGVCNGAADVAPDMLVALALVADDNTDDNHQHQHQPLPPASAAHIERLTRAVAELARVVRGGGGTGGTAPAEDVHVYDTLLMMAHIMERNRAYAAHMHERVASGNVYRARNIELACDLREARVLVNSVTRYNSAMDDRVEALEAKLHRAHKARDYHSTAYAALIDTAARRRRKRRAAAQLERDAADAPPPPIAVVAAAAAAAAPLPPHVIDLTGSSSDDDDGDDGDWGAHLDDTFTRTAGAPAAPATTTTTEDEDEADAAPATTTTTTTEDEEADEADAALASARRENARLAATVARLEAQDRRQAAVVAVQRTTIGQQVAYIGVLAKCMGVPQLALQQQQQHSPHTVRRYDPLAPLTHV